MNNFSYIYFYLKNNMIREKRKYTHEHIAEKERTFMGIAVGKCVCI